MKVKKPRSITSVKISAIRYQDCKHPPTGEIRKPQAASKIKFDFEISPGIPRYTKVILKG